MEEHPNPVAQELISKRKQQYPITASLGQYLHHFGRLSQIPLVYDDLTHSVAASPYENPRGEETLWLTVAYDPQAMEELRPKLTQIYAILKIGGDLRMAEHLEVERIDFGEFGNSRPFRVRITNVFNGNSDYYYVKQADASRIYGLELEHILSPNRINYLVNGNTLIEDHISGVPGDMFRRRYLPDPELNKVRIAKQFVKFGERCWARLLGDMRTVNYVVEITPDFEEVQYRVRPIDFDQQSYEGSLLVYRAHRFPDNKPVDDLVRSHLNTPTIIQYRNEERSQLAVRAKVARTRLTGLLSTMRKDALAPEDHVENLRADLSARYGEKHFEGCRTMGDLTAAQIQYAIGHPATLHGGGG